MRNKWIFCYFCWNLCNKWIIPTSISGASWVSHLSYVYIFRHYGLVRALSRHSTGMFTVLNSSGGFIDQWYVSYAYRCYVWFCWNHNSMICLLIFPECPMYETQYICVCVCECVCQVHMSRWVVCLIRLGCGINSRGRPTWYQMGSTEPARPENLLFI